MPNQVMANNLVYFDTSPTYIPVNSEKYAGVRSILKFHKGI